MGMIKADDVFSALASFALNANEVLRIDVIAIVRRIGARVAAARDARDCLRAIVVEVAEEDSATLVGIGFLPVLAKRVIVGLGNFYHV